MSDLQKLVFQAVALLPAIFVWAWMLRRVKERGGRVPTSGFGWPDLLLAFFLCGVFALAPLREWLAPEAGATVSSTQAMMRPESQIVQSLLLFLGFIVVIWVSLRYRKISPAEMFGLRRFSPVLAFLVGSLVIAAIFPMLAVLGHAIQSLLQEAVKEQEVVTYFRKVQETGNSRSIGLIVFAAVFFQPAVEELLFRGYFYGVFKGWAGALASAVFTATLFAAIHTNVAALLPLLAFALVLTLAYEWSGSLLVPISMHMVFNGVQLAVLTLAPQWVTQ
jgi:uncharacterized protein